MFPEVAQKLALQQWARIRWDIVPEGHGIATGNQYSYSEITSSGRCDLATTMPVTRCCLTGGGRARDDA